MNQFILDNLAFLQTLQTQMRWEEQHDNECQAAPRFWALLDYKREPCWEGHAESWVIYSPSAAGDYTLDETTIQEVIDNYELTGKALHILNRFHDLKTKEILAWFHEHIDNEAYLVPQHTVSFVVPDTFFITKAEAKQHIERNQHRYTSKVQTYGMTAIRAPQVEQLWNILHTLDIDALRAYVTTSNETPSTNKE